MKPPELSIPEIDSLSDISNYEIDDFKLLNYEHHPAIKAKMAI
jgi:thymidylate synthase